MAHRAIGLDIGSSALRAVQLSFDKSGVKLDAVGEVSLPDGAVVDGTIVDVAVVRAALKQLWKEHRFAGRHVHLGVANQRVVVREITVPTMPADDLALALPYQVKDMLPMPVEAAVLDFHPLQQTTSPTGLPVTRGLLVAAAREMVLANVEAVEGAGLKVTSIDLAPFAVLRAVGARLDDEAGVEALIEIGSNITSIVIHSDGVASFVRILLSGGADITEALAEETGLSTEAAEALKVEHGLLGPDDSGHAAIMRMAVERLGEGLRSTLDHYAAAHPGRAVERTVLTGGGAELLGLPEELSAYLRLPVVIGNPAAYLLEDSRHTTSAVTTPSSAVSVGLALGAVR